MSRSLTIICNPFSGLRRSAAILAEIRPILAASGFELDIHETGHAGHGAELAAGLPLHDAAGLCVIGGDGTFHEVLNGFMAREEHPSLPLGLIPGGTGNSLCHDLGSTSPAGTARRIAAYQPQALDVIRVESADLSCYAFNLVGFGLVVSANQKAERLRHFGRKRYDIAALWDIAFHRHHTATLTVDGGEPVTGDFGFITGMNTVHTGLGMQLAPRAQLADGKLDLLTLRSAGRRDMIRMLRAVRSGQHIMDPLVEYRQVVSFEITTPTAAGLNIDGELIGRTPVKATIQPGAVRLL